MSNKPKIKIDEEGDLIYVSITTDNQAMLVCVKDKIINLGTATTKRPESWANDRKWQHLNSLGIFKDEQLEQTIETIREKYKSMLDSMTQDEILSVVVASLPIPTQKSINYCVEQLRSEK